MRLDFDAAIVGAGPAGAPLAALLARAGWTAAIVEKHPFPRRKVCGECIAAGNLDVLDALGLGPRFAALAGAELRRVELHVGGASAGAPLPALEGAHPWGRALGREHLDGLLLDAAREAGACVFQPWTARRLVAAPGGYDLDISRARETMTLRARVLVLAHGSWSPQPALGLGLREVRRDRDLFAFKANYVRASLEPGVLPVLAFAGGYGGMVVAEQGIATLAGCIRRDRLAAIRRQHASASAGEAFEAHVLNSCAGVRRALDTAQREGPWLAVGPIRPGVRPCDTRPAVFAIGNAAGEAHPIVGEGIGMALQAAWLLSRRLIDGGPVRDPRAWALARELHDAEWRRHFVPRIRAAAACASVALRPVLAGAAVAALRGMPSLLTSVARLAGKARPAALGDGAPPCRGLHEVHAPATVEALPRSRATLES